MMIGRDDIRAFLFDRQWHSGVELYDHLIPKMPPEQASQAFYAERKRDMSHVPVDAAVRRGAQIVITKLLSNLVKSGSVMTTGARSMIERNFRLVEWRCGFCGGIVANSPEKSESGLCPHCEDLVRSVKE